MASDAEKGPLPAGATNSRRTSGARHESSTRVVLLSQDSEVEGWTLNMSQGGLRAVLTEHVVKTGDECSVLLGSEEDVRPVRCRVVWTREQKDGQIVGLEFILQEV